MKKILIVGAGGQIGSELVPHLRSIYGNNNVVAADISAEKCKALAEAGPFEELNALDGEGFSAIVKKYNSHGRKEPQTRLGHQYWCFNQLSVHCQG